MTCNEGTASAAVASSPHHPNPSTLPAPSRAPSRSEYGRLQDVCEVIREAPLHPDTLLEELERANCEWGAVKGARSFANGEGDRELCAHAYEDFFDEVSPMQGGHRWQWQRETRGDADADSSPPNRTGGLGE